MARWWREWQESGEKVAGICLSIRFELPPAQATLGCMSEIQQPPTDQLLVTARDAARLLSIGERTLARLTAAGEMPCVHIGKSLRYRVATLQDFVAQRENKEPASA